MGTISKALRKRVADCTNAIFQECVREVMGLKEESEEDLQVAMDFVRAARFAQLGLGEYEEQEIKKMVEAKAQVDEMYIAKMIRLPTKQLNDIIKVHQAGVIKRAPRTIEAIVSELTRRSLFGDTNESDMKAHHGDVNGLKTKSKRGRKKTATSRSKTSKNRRGKRTN
jgi:tRNA A37 methylthiotransferase MiaB